MEDKQEDVKPVCEQIRYRQRAIEAEAAYQRIFDEKTARCERIAELEANVTELQVEACRDELVISGLEAQLAEHEWVSVEDRLPGLSRHGQRIMAYGKDGYGYKIVAAVSYDCEFKKFRILSDVTHWKPIHLPAEKSEAKEPGTSIASKIMRDSSFTGKR